MEDKRRVLFYLQKNFYIIFSDEPAKWKKVVENIIAILGEKIQVIKSVIRFYYKANRKRYYNI